MTMSRARVAFLCIAFALALGFVVAATPRTPPDSQLKTPGIAIPAAFFGMHIHRASTITPWPNIPFDAWRLWDAGVDWPSLEPQKEQWNFAKLDKYVDLAQEHGVEILLTLAWSPAWASARPNDKGYGPLGSASEPKDIADWRNYVQTVATRYKGRIHDYEIWNEPNSTGFYTGSVPALVQLARVAYTTLKQVDPTIVVSSPPAAGSSSLRWFDEYLRAGGGNYADVIGYHFYVNPDPPEEMVPLIQQVEQIMRNDGVGDKPLWDTETGWAIQNEEGSVKPAGARGFNSIVLPEDLAAAYVARAYVLAWASGVSRQYWYAWDNGVMGLVEPDWKTPKLSGIAYGQVENWLVGATMTSCASTSAGIWDCVISQPRNYLARILWNPNGTVSMPIPTNWKVSDARYLNGSVRSLNDAGSIQVGPSPLLLESSK